jgi:excisionase family DNA binding protein
MARITVSEAADRAGVSVSLVYQWCAERRLPHFRLGRCGRRGKLLIEQDDLDVFLESSRVEATQEETQVDDLHHIRRRR